MPTIRLRIIFEGGRLGPGKVELMERIEELGSIAAAGRALGMSYRRAWSLVDESNALFGRALIEKQHGGKAGGGATLTDLGRTVVGYYRDIEQTTTATSRSYFEGLQAEIEKSPASISTG